MLYVLNDNTIKLTRGDTALLSIDIYNETIGNSYELAADDKLTLSVKKTLKGSTYCFQKTITGSTSITIKPEDTRNLDFGDYFYDVQLNTSTGDVYTVIEPSPFVVMPEVTYN